MSEDEQRTVVRHTWRELTARQRFLYHKMILGELRVGVAHKLVVRALAEVAGVEPGVMAHRMSGRWMPTADAFLRLMRGDEGQTDPARPYPFYLAYPLERSLDDLGLPSDWQAEWKWDGIRAQLIHRGVQPVVARGSSDSIRNPQSEIRNVLVWSRGEELITEGFPEIADVARQLPAGTVLDGEILAWEDDRPLPFALLQRRINRKREEPRLWDEVPVIFMAYDLLEHEGQDVRSLPLSERRAMLERVGASFGPSRHFRISPVIAFTTWEDLRAHHEQARELGSEGIMLKRLSSPYGVDRQRGDWWKWKVDPYTIDAVLIYAQLGNGKRANLFTDYTFGLWSNGELVPVAKAYSGLTDEEIRQVDSFVRRHTLDRHGPLRVVKPELVFELAFENIQVSTRHKSGLAVRFPRMARWRQDKKPEEADTLETLRTLLHQKEVNRQGAKMKGEMQITETRKSGGTKDREAIP
jgi:DNA ligase-1